MGFGREEADDCPWGSWFRRRGVPKGSVSGGVLGGVILEGTRGVPSVGGVIPEVLL